MDTGRDYSLQETTRHVMIVASLINKVTSWEEVLRDQNDTVLRALDKAKQVKVGIRQVRRNLPEEVIYYAHSKGKVPTLRVPEIRLPVPRRKGIHHPGAEIYRVASLGEYLDSLDQEIKELRIYFRNNPKGKIRDLRPTL